MVRAKVGRVAVQMRSSGWVLALLGLFAACSDTTHGDEPGAGAASGASSSAAGHGGSMGVAGHAGSTAASAGSSGTSGGAGMSASGGAAGGGMTSVGGSGGRSGAGVAGATAGDGGKAGQALVAGSGGTLAGTSGTANDAGAGGQDTAGAGGVPADIVGLSWPIDCVPGDTCVNLGYPDIDGDGKAFDCSDAGYVGHEGTDIGITFEAEEAGTAVRAAADGVVLFAFDGKYDQCPNDAEPDCQDPPSTGPGSMTGNTVCTPLGPYCGTGTPSCYWCFAGGNVIVLRHTDVPGVFATRYDHLKKGSVLVEPGDTVTRGQKLAEAASAGNSTGPHLHFEVWGTGFYELAEPWAGTCGPNHGPSLWAHDPPWSE